MGECEQNPTMIETLEWLIQDYDDGSSVALSVVSLRMIINEHAELKRELLQWESLYGKYPGGPALLAE